MWTTRSCAMVVARYRGHWRHARRIVAKRQWQRRVPKLRVFTTQEWHDFCESGGKWPKG
jgi:hypothetical protein